MNATSVDIKDMLDGDSSLGLTFAVDLFVAKEPAEPDNCVTIFDTSVQQPQLTLDPTEKYLYEAIQIRVRNNDYNAAMSLANDIFDSLQGRAETIGNGTVYSVIYGSGGPTFLDWDKNNRARIVINFKVQRR